LHLCDIGIMRRVLLDGVFKLIELHVGTANTRRYTEAVACLNSRLDSFPRHTGLRHFSNGIEGVRQGEEFRALFAQLVFCLPGLFPPTVAESAVAIIVGFLELRGAMRRLQWTESQLDILNRHILLWSIELHEAWQMADVMDVGRLMIHLLAHACRAIRTYGCLPLQALYISERLGSQ